MDLSHLTVSYPFQIFKFETYLHRVPQQMQSAYRKVLHCIAENVKVYFKLKKPVLVSLVIQFSLYLEG